MSSGVMLSDVATFIFAIESTRGVDAVDALIAANTDIVYDKVGTAAAIDANPLFYTPDVVRPSQSGVAHEMVKSSTSGTIPFPMRAGVGSANTPNWGKFLEVANFKKTTSGTSTTYTLKTSSGDTLSGHEYRLAPDADGTRKWRLTRILGARGGFGFTAETSKELWGELKNLLGENHDDLTVARAYFNASDKPALKYDGTSYTYTGAATADVAEKLMCQAITLTIGGTTFYVSKFTFDTNMGVNPIDAMNGATNNAATIVSRQGTTKAGGDLAFETQDGGTALDYALTLYQASGEAALSAVFANSTRKLTVSMPKVQLTRPSRRNNNGAMGFDLGYSVNGDFASAPFGDNGVVFTLDNV